jgi:RNA polymerase sigma factor (TIGR02999 family)
VYDELCRIAERKLRSERAGHTLQPTALVHEAYVRLLEQNQPDYQNRAQFFGIAARVMRQILVDHARRTAAAKRGGEKLPLEDFHEPAAPEEPEILDLEMALSRLETQDETKARLIELRYFGGLTAEESATVTGMNVAQVRRELRVAQAWLSREMGNGPAGPAEVFSH